MRGREPFERKLVVRASISTDHFHRVAQGREASPDMRCTFLPFLIHPEKTSE